MIWIEAMGWIATALVLIGYWCNATERRQAAFTVWVVGDVLWILYDVLIQNWSHMVLSGTIIALNVYGMSSHFFKRKIKHNDN